MIKSLYKIIIGCFVAVLNIIYLPIKLLPAKDKITMVSRQSNVISLDFKMLRDRINADHPDVEVIVMTRKMPNEAIKLPGYFCHLIVQMYHLATSKVAITDSYGIAISVLKHKKNLEIIQIWHALGAIKRFGYQTIGKSAGHSYEVAKSLKMHKNYDHILAVSDETAKYFCEAFNVSDEKVKNLALPRAEYILTEDKKKADEIRAYYNVCEEKENILYAPTFRKNEKIQIMDLIERFDFDRFNLIIKLHPLDMKSLDVPVMDGLIIDSKFLTYDLAKFCDRIITDYSALGIEVSLLNKPLYFYVYDIVEYRENPGLNVDLQNEMGKYAIESAESLTKELKKEYDFDVLERFRNKYIALDCSNAAKKLSDFFISKM